MTTNEKALKMHEEWNGKIEVISRAKVSTPEELSVAFPLFKLYVALLMGLYVLHKSISIVEAGVSDSEFSTLVTVLRVSPPIKFN